MAKNIRLSDHFTYGKLLCFTLPSMVMMVFTSIYGVVDGLFVSNFVGKTAFASVNLVMPFVMILGGMGFMIGTGGTALVSKILGEGDPENANRTFSMMVLFTLALGVVLSGIGIAFMGPVARFLGATDAMMADCVLYGRISTLLLPFLRPDGKSESATREQAALLDLLSVVMPFVLFRAGNGSIFAGRNRDVMCAYHV